MREVYGDSHPANATIMESRRENENALCHMIPTYVQSPTRQLRRLGRELDSRPRQYLATSLSDPVEQKSR